MKIYGLDFTSAPTGKKPLVAVACFLDGRTLRVEGVETLGGFEGFEAFLGGPGEWVCGMDFPFGQPRDLVKALRWPETWEGYVGEVGRLPKEVFESAIRNDMASRPAGRKWRYRLADRRSGSSSAMMLFRVPVGKMFYRGAPRLLDSGVNVVPCRPSAAARTAVEAYPAVVARRFLGRASYKRDGVPDTPARRAARETLVSGVRSDTLRKAYGFTVALDGGIEVELVADPAADALDSVLCAVQAAWAYSKREEGWGVPPECDPDEGWILDPALSNAPERQPI
ncbi:MAG TPA: DUF429 domain-containing protein [Rubrobacteraceae bacterium]|nr:DUF429 domain-containing protein [Rubrobacteraceae bacterium]